MSRRGSSDDDDDEAGSPSGGATQRIDKWLWFVRVVKTRTLAAALVTGGKVRVNRARIEKPGTQVRPGDVVTVATGPRVRVLKVVLPGERRGPPAEAQTLYEEIEQPRLAITGSAAAAAGGAMPSGRREPGAGRPTKRDRRALDKLRSS